MRSLRDEYKGFWIPWLELLEVFFTITINYDSSQSRLSKTRTIPYRTTGVFLFHCDRLGSDLRVGHFYCVCLERWLSYECRSCLHGSLYSLQSPWKMFVACSHPWKPLLIPLTWKASYVRSRSPQKRVLASRCLAMDYSGFQASCNDMNN
jgi:hypothetical protein